MYEGYMLICNTLLINKNYQKFQPIDTIHFLGFYKTISDIVDDIKNVNQFNDIVWGLLGIYDSDSDSDSGLFYDVGQRNGHEIMFDYQVIECDFGKIISQGGGSTADKTEFTNPLVSSNTLEELEMKLRTLINPNESMQAFIHNKKGLPTVTNQRIYSYLKFSKKKNKKKSKKNHKNK
jgi:hypothetical protein